MGNGSMKPKQLKWADRHAANVPISSSGNSKLLEEPALGVHATGRADVLRSKMLELRRKEEEFEKKLITDALVKRLYPQQIQDTVEYYGRTNQQGSYILKQGDPGNHISVLAEGRVEVFQQNKLLSSIPEWTTFGGLGILYNFTRTASVKVHSDDVRSANIIAEENDVLCLVIDSEPFMQTVGTIEELQRHLEGYVANLAHVMEKKTC
ncbi:LOW QUALITY PROTEIN: cGMP-dependent protein kinase 2 [Pangshura tecta]